jgi:poly(3-hydroxybutyrate) depolymerase
LAHVSAQTTAENSTAEVIQSGGLERAFVLHVGKKVEAARPAALVVVLHGSGGNGNQLNTLMT